MTKTITLQAEAPASPVATRPARSPASQAAPSGAQPAASNTASHAAQRPATRSSHDPTAETPVRAGRLEHINYTVADPDRTAAMLEAVFGWHVRWAGPSIHGGRSVHVGTDDRYVALYSKGDRTARPDNYTTPRGLNHLGILVDDLAAAERRVLAHGIETHSHQTYDPGSRFYFHDADGIEYEVVSYA